MSLGSLVQVITDALNQRVIDVEYLTDLVETSLNEYVSQGVDDGHKFRRVIQSLSFSPTALDICFVMFCHFLPALRLRYH